MGAWIETSDNHLRKKYIKVAPPVGAWIETYLRLSVMNIFLVAPPVGAWIETVNCSFFSFLISSRPPWARGLKQNTNIGYNRKQGRAPRGRVD